MHSIPGTASKPRSSSEETLIVEGFLQHFADLSLVPVTYDVAREAARLRALIDLPMPDA